MHVLLCFSPYAVRFWKSLLSSKLYFSVKVSQISSHFHPWHIRAGVLHCHMAATTRLSGSVMLFLSFHDINSLTCLSAANTAERRARQHCSYCTSNGENIISSLPLPCQVPVCIWHIEYVYYRLTTWTILDFLLHIHSRTHEHTPCLDIPSKHQVSDCERSVLWEMDCHLRVPKLQMANLETIQSCFASGEIRHFQKEVLEIGSEQDIHAMNLFTSDRHLTPALILLFSFPLLCLWCIFSSYPYFFTRDPADQFPPRCSPNSSGLPHLWTTITRTAGCCGNLMLFSGFFRIGHVNLELRVGIPCFSQNHIA